MALQCHTSDGTLLSGSSRRSGKRSPHILPISPHLTPPLTAFTPQHSTLHHTTRICVTSHRPAMSIALRVCVCVCVCVCVHALGTQRLVVNTATNQPPHLDHITAVETITQQSPSHAHTRIRLAVAQTRKVGQREHSTVGHSGRARGYQHKTSTEESLCV
jgi:hypothetical protein